jgi:hypothetical protein
VAVTTWGTNARSKKTLKCLIISKKKGEISVGKPRKGWSDNIENGLKKIGFGGWKKIVRDGDA